MTYRTAIYIHEVDFLLPFKIFKILRNASKKPVVLQLTVSITVILVYIYVLKADIPRN